MLVAVLSDVHDNIWNLAGALRQAREMGAVALVFCGDFCAPFTLSQMGQDFDGPVHCVLGNNDGDPRLLLRNAQQEGNVTLYGQYAELEIGSRHIAVNHYPEIAAPLAASGAYDLVCYGHNHVARVEQVGRTVLANPGEVMGRFGSPSFGVYDCATGMFSLHEVRHYPVTGSD